MLRHVSPIDLPCAKIFSGLLPEMNLKSAKMIQVSSYDKSGGNADCVPMKLKEKLTFMDVKGAGNICRLWLTVAVVLIPFYLRDMVIRMYWDGEKTSSVEAPLGDFFGIGFDRYVHHHLSTKRRIKSPAITHRSRTGIKLSRIMTLRSFQRRRP